MINPSKQNPVSQNSEEQVMNIEQSKNEEEQIEDGFNKLVLDLSETISKVMLPLYEKITEQIEDRKVLSKYSILKFPTQSQIKQRKLLQAVQSFRSPQQSIKQSDPSFQNYKYQKGPEPQRQMHEMLDYRDQNSQRFGPGFSGYPSPNFSQRPTFQGRNMNHFSNSSYHQYSTIKQMKAAKRLKRKMNKNRPKKAKSAYNLFVEDVVPQIKALNPSFGAPDLVRVAAKMYNQLTQVQKQPYQKKYLQDKKRFDRQREEYFRNNPHMDYRYDKMGKNSYNPKHRGVVGHMFERY